MAKNSKRKSPEKLNQEYFKSLIATRASIASLAISFAGLAISLICLPITWHVAMLGYQIEPLQSKANIMIIFVAVFMFVTLLMISFRFTRNILIRHQGFASVWLTIFSILLTFIIMFLFYIVTLYDNDKPNELWYGSRFPIIVLSIYVIAYLGSLIYNIFWLKKQLRDGFSEGRATANYFAKASVYESKSLWIIFGCTMLGAFLTGNFMKVFGLLFGIIIAAAFSRLTVEYFYAAYLLNTNKDYWINYTQEPKMPLSVKLKRRLKKQSTYVILSIILIVGISLIVDRYEVPEIVYTIFLYVFLASFICLVVIFIMWSIKKIKNKIAGGKNV